MWLAKNKLLPEWLDLVVFGCFIIGFSWVAFFTDWLSTLISQATPAWFIVVVFTSMFVWLVLGSLAISSSIAIKKFAAILRLPATLLHEISHAIFAILGGGVPINIKVWPPKLREESTQYGRIVIRMHPFSVAHWTFPFGPFVLLIAVGAIGYVAPEILSIGGPTLLMIIQMYLFIGGWPSTLDWSAIPMFKRLSSKGLLWASGIVNFSVGICSLGFAFSLWIASTT